MARQLQGKEKKETAAQRRARKEGNAEAQQYVVYVLGGLGGFFLLIFMYLIYLSYSQSSD